MKTRLGFLVTILSMTAGCGGDAACVPGEQVECACAGGAKGAQACNAEGAAFEACSCDGNPNPSGGLFGETICDQLTHEYATAFTRKYDECDIEPRKPEGGAGEGGAGEGGAPPCTAELQAQIECFNDCLPLVTCGVLNGTDDAALIAFVDCITPCTE
jgi:hypothetical protein